MKKIVLLFLTTLLSVAGFAQCVSVGLRDNDNVFVGYEGKWQWFAGVDNTVHIESLEGQATRLIAGIREKQIAKRLDVSAVLWGGTSWNFAYAALDATARLSYHPWKKFTIEAGGGIHHDSEVGTSGLWDAALRLHAFKEVSFVVEATNRVVFREADSRLYVGVDFQVRRLSVAPRLSIPLDDNIRYARVSVSLKYDIPCGKKRDS